VERSRTTFRLAETACGVASYYSDRVVARGNARAIKVKLANCRKYDRQSVYVPIEIGVSVSQECTSIHTMVWIERNSPLHLTNRCFAYMLQDVATLLQAMQSLRV
jgi:hypothetical protein